MNDAHRREIRRRGRSKATAWWATICVLALLAAPGSIAAGAARATGTDVEIVDIRESPSDPDSGLVFGEIRSPKPLCRADRRVRVLVVVNGRDRLEDVGFSSRRGAFSGKVGPGSGIDAYKVVVERKKLRRTTCERASDIVAAA